MHIRVYKLPPTGLIQKLPLGPRRRLPPRTPLSGAAAPEPPQYASIQTNSNKCALRTIRTCSMFIRKHLVTKTILLHLNHIGDTKSPTQFQEISLLNDIPHGVISKTEDKRVKMIKTKRKANAYEPTKKLNEMKISLTFMEWYMKGQRSKGGYYDSYKNANTTKDIECQQEVIKHQRILNQYWKNIVQDNNLKPQKGLMVLNRWLYGGTNYRRIVEPLDIADHYKKGKTNYMAIRPNYYELLERWLEDGKNDQKPSKKKTKASSLTEDSCFWAHVEEALILLSKLENGDLSSIATDMERFEIYVWGAIQNFILSPDVFIEGSSFMKWWRKYKAYKGSSYDSKFARYMNNGSYKSYQ